MILENIIKRELRNLVESKKAKGKIADQIDEFASIMAKIQKFETEIKKLKANPKYADMKDKVSQIMEELKATGEDTLETKRFFLKISRTGSEAETTKYAAVLAEFLPQVDAKLQETFKRLKDANTTVTKRSPSIDVTTKKEVKENESGKPSLGGILSSIKSVHSMINRLKAKVS